MTSQGVSALKFVGTVSLGLLTGLSYSLSTVTVPSILSLPSASSASRAFHSLAATSTLQLRTLTGLSSASLILAFFLSPRPYRHPYLVYTSVMALATGLADQIAPFVSRPSDSDSNSAEQTNARAARLQARRERTAAREAARAARMEASYEVLSRGDSHSEGSAGGSVSGGEDLEAEEEKLNGEEVRGEVEEFLRTQYVQTAFSALGFLMAVVGIWGDGAVQVFQETVVFRS